MSDIQEHVDHIINQIENPEDNYCPSCECEQESAQDGECPDCGEELTTMGGYDYIRDALDIEYVIGSNGDYLGARVLVTCGGPNIWINTRNNTVEGYWWSDSYTASFSDEIGLDDALSELWECR